MYVPHLRAFWARDDLYARYSTSSVVNVNMPLDSDFQVQSESKCQNFTTQYLIHLLYLSQEILSRPIWHLLGV